MIQAPRQGESKKNKNKKKTEKMFINNFQQKLQNCNTPFSDCD